MRAFALFIIDCMGRRENVVKALFEEILWSNNIVHVIKKCLVIRLNLPKM